VYRTQAHITYSSSNAMTIIAQSYFANFQLLVC